MDVDFEITKRLDAAQALAACAVAWTQDPRLSRSALAVEEIDFCARASSRMLLAVIALEANA
jgi:hypothetical protein